MPLTNKDKQAAFRERKRQAGYRQVVVWVHESKYLKLMAYLKRLKNESNKPV